MKIFEQKCYRTAVSERLAEKKQQVSSQYTFARLAAACKVQATYLSRSLSQRKAHLNEDQLFRACRFLGFTEDEASFLFLLRSWEQSVDPERRQAVEAQIAAIRSQQQLSEAHLKKARPTGHSTQEAISRYFLDPDYILVHVCLAIPRFAARPQLLCPQLGIEEIRLTEVLSYLESLGYIRMEHGGYTLLESAIHLPAGSPLFAAHRLALRLRAFERTRRLPADKTYNFSACFTCDQPTQNKIRDEFLAFLTKVEQLTHNSNDEEAYQLNFDLFPWT